MPHDMNPMMQVRFSLRTHLSVKVSFSCCVLMSVALGCTSSAGGTDPGPSHVDLFACGIDLSCNPIILHAFDPIDPQKCAARLLVSNLPGALSKVNSPGPYLDELAELAFFFGDGTVLVQSRVRHCGGPGDKPCTGEGWGPVSGHRRCKVEIPPGLEQACAPECMSCPCDWFPEWSECELVE